MAGRRCQPLILAIALLAPVWGCGRQEVEVVSPRRSAIAETFSEPAETRQPEIRTLTMPLDGRIDRIDLDPGDKVRAGQAIAAFDATPYRLAAEEARAAVAQFEAEIRLKDNDQIEMTLLEGTKAIVESTDDALKAAEAETEAERVRLDRAVKQLDRTLKLVGEGTITESDLDDAQLLADTSRINLRRQEFTEKSFLALYTAVQLGPTYIRQYLELKRLERRVLEAHLERAQAQLAIAEHNLSLAEVAAPVDGVVLRRFTRGEGTLAAGTPLVEIGEPDRLEVVAEVLTQDALLLKPGGRVELDPGGAEQTAEGRVRRIDPSAFTKRSSLGVEQQRVNAVIDFVEKPPKLGVGYRVQATFLLASKENALVVPRFSVLEAPDGAHYVLKAVDGKLERQDVTVGLKGELDVEIVAGLTESDTIVRTPDADMKSGDRIKPVAP